MNVQYSIFDLTSCEDTGNVTFSPELPSGPTPCALPDGETIPKFGRDPVHANRSAPRASGKARRTNAIYGRLGFDSSPSAALAQSLLSRLQAATASLGSTMFTLTWKERITPSGRLIYALRASGVPTSGSDCSSWPTPNTPSGGPNTEKTESHTGGMDLDGAAQLASWPTPNCPNGGRVQSEEATITQRRTDGTKAQAGLENVAALASWATPRNVQAGHSTGNPANAENHKSRLEDQVFLAAHWATPATRDWKDNGDLSGSMIRKDGQIRDDTLGRQASMVAPLSGWPTPAANEYEQKDQDALMERRAQCKERNGNGNGFGLTLGNAAQLTGWPTPMAGTQATETYNAAGNNDYSRKVVSLVQPMDSGETPSGSGAGTASTGQLNPALSRWLQGLPPIFDLCAITAVRNNGKRKPR
jgi:hypothetical protein